ncbi:ClpP/crotonase-like domain-containing protein [Chytriomyces sp. MP71]|nr:ClpP/crotonase-like domain-containing protein [Chytriomyces sp. MP71]
MFPLRATLWGSHTARASRACQHIHRYNTAADPSSGGSAGSPVGTGIVSPFVDVSQHFKPVTALSHGSGRVLVLNNARMDLDMMQLVSRHLEAWDHAKDVKVIALVKRSNVPVFCGGLKVPFEAEWEPALEQASLLAHRVATLNTPFVSLMDGPTHGLGASLSLHASFRIATETTALSLSEGPASILCSGVPGSAFALRHLLLDDADDALESASLGKYLVLTGDVLRSAETVLAGIATHQVPSERISALIKRLCETKSSDLRILDLAIEEFTDSSPSTDDWKSWRLGGSNFDAIHRCFKHTSLGEIVKALQAEKSEWSKAVLAMVQRNSPTAMELAIESFNLVSVPKKHLLASFKDDLNMVRNLQVTPDFQASIKHDADLDASPPPQMPAQVVLDPHLASRDSWLASELDGATDAAPQPPWNPTLTAHLAATSGARSRKSWMAKGGWLETPFEEVDAEKRAIDGETSLWLGRTYAVYPWRTVTGLPAVRDVKKVVKGEAAGSGDVAMTRDELLDYFASNWNTFLDEERNLTPLSASPLESWRLEDAGTGKTGEDEAPGAVPFYPSKIYDLDTVADPKVSGEDGNQRYAHRRKEEWGLRQRMEYLMDTKCVFVNGYVQWKN